ncbi:MAG: reductive dehalogenase [bacterium]|nr:reductive dehalogenase [bacterium]
MGDQDQGSKLNRRQFLKASGAAGAVAGSAGLGLFGYAAGKDPNSYLGWKSFEGGDQTFDRKSWEVDEPTYQKIGTGSRPDARVENIFDRRGRFRRQYQEGVQIGDLDELLQSHYTKHPNDLDLDILDIEEISPKLRADSGKYRMKFLLANSWSRANSAVNPRQDSRPPEIADFPGARRGGSAPEPVKLKSPQKTSKLIKKIAHELGSTLVGITRLNPDWVYSHTHNGRGFDVDTPLEVPAHWEYAIAVGTPMSWDPMYANPNYGTSEDAYSRTRIVAYRLASFIKQLGYAARPHVPGNSYDLMVPPILVDAGLGEQGRHSIVITPELGCNFRAAIVTTNIPMQIDKPIDIGVQDFCESCHICADNCPSSSITKEDRIDIRGYRRWEIDKASCLNFWNSTLGSMGCRLCIASCPYTRKANWLHKAAFKVSLNDPTGLADKVLTSLQKSFYETPDPQKYYIPSLGGENASYREPPWWLRSEDFIDF